MAEKYQVLARRYRPQRFSDVVGQEAVLQTLKNAISRDQVAHAYLFSGSRGVGKTTLARLFAKALNCASLSSDGEPCNSCPSCLDISSGQSLDVIEIDGASNRGIDDIRQINETVGFAPSHGKYKITIIDEVHMLTKEAFNALLKTLEEPPEKAKFFFATTEPHKVLPTIISRCQRFDLGRILPLQIFAKLTSIAQELKREVEPEALHLIAHFADGSLRDAESLFDQILCFSPLKITAADVRSSLGLVSQDLFFALDLAFSESRLSFAFELVDQLFQAGLDLGHFLDQLIEHYRNLAVCKTFKTSSLTPDLAARYTQSAALYTQPQCLSILDLLLKAQTQSARSTSPKIALEMTLLQILRTKNRLPIEVLIRRLSDLEESLQTQSAHVPTSPAPSPSEAHIVPPAQPIQETQPLQIPTPDPVESAPPQLSEPLFTPPQLPPTLEAAVMQVENTFISDSKPNREPDHKQTEEAPSFPTPAVETWPELAALPIAAEEEHPPFKTSLATIVEKIFDEAPHQDLTPIDQTPLFQTDILDRPAPTPSPFTPSTTTAVKTEMAPPPLAPPLANKHPSHYHTLMRFTAVELEGTFKN